MKPRHQRMVAIAAGVALVTIAAALVLNAFQGNVVFFSSPSQIAAKEAPLERTFRVGGLLAASDRRYRIAARLREDASTADATIIRSGAA